MLFDSLTSARSGAHNIGLNNSNQISSSVIPQPPDPEVGQERGKGASGGGGGAAPMVRFVGFRTVHLFVSAVCISVRFFIRIGWAAEFRYLV